MMGAHRIELPSFGFVSSEGRGACDRTRPAQRTGPPGPQGDLPTTPSIRSIPPKPRAMGASRTLSPAHPMLSLRDPVP